MMFITMTCWRCGSCGMRRSIPSARRSPGVLMISGALIWLAAPVALFIGTIGAVSVIKAVYIDKRELKCACNRVAAAMCLWASSRLTENLMMVAMAIWMLSQGDVSRYHCGTDCPTHVSTRARKFSPSAWGRSVSDLKPDLRGARATGP